MQEMNTHYHQHSQRNLVEVFNDLLAKVTATVVLVAR